jgi:hypothetical protein
MGAWSYRTHQTGTPRIAFTAQSSINVISFCDPRPTVVTSTALRRVEADCGSCMPNGFASLPAAAHIIAPRTIVAETRRIGGARAVRSPPAHTRASICARSFGEIGDGIPRAMLEFRPGSSPRRQARLWRDASRGSVRGRRRTRAAVPGSASAREPSPADVRLGKRLLARPRAVTLSSAADEERSCPSGCIVNGRF